MKEIGPRIVVVICLDNAVAMGVLIQHLSRLILEVSTGSLA